MDPTPKDPAQPSKRPTRNRSVGHVIECDGTRAKISTISGVPGTGSADYWAVGQLISIQVGKNRVVGLLYQVDAPSGRWVADRANEVNVHVELVGEVQTQPDDSLHFSSGIRSYPHLGAIAHRIRSADLMAIYQATQGRTIQIGTLSQSPDIPALISFDNLISRHFAIVGTTGTGKSTAVALLLHKVVEADPNQRILILDPHNEFTNAFGRRAHKITAETLNLPFWLLNLEEFSEVIFRGRTVPDDEIDALREFVPRAKALYANPGSKTARRGMISSNITADTPVPYRIAELLGLLDEEIGSLDAASRRTHLRSLYARIEAVINDPSFAFLFASNTVSDRFAQTISEIYRVPINGKPITVFELSGIPSDVVDSVASVLCRLAFELAIASQGRIKTLVVCEEAHRYIPADTTRGFAPTRAAISRIAKEGRKYGVSLAIITQRPHELDATILSQCNTIFALRLGNEADQEVMRQAIASGSRSSINFLSSLADREAIAFGHAVATPMRMIFQTLKAAGRPSSVNDAADNDAPIDPRSLGGVVAALRGTSAKPRDTTEAPEPAPAPEAARAPRPQPVRAERPAQPEPQPTRAAPASNENSRIASPGALDKLRASLRKD